MKSILVTGSSGLVGNAIKSIQSDYQYNYIFTDSSWCNLKDYTETFKMFNAIKPHIVIHLAAVVGGLFKNMNSKVSMFEENLLINTNVVKAAHEAGVQTLVACLSTCVFPDEVEGFLNEEMLHDGPPHSSNEGYAYAKRMMEVHCRLYKECFHRNYFCIIPTNIYGPNDNFNLEDGHVIPSLIHKCYLAQKQGIPFEIRGTGAPLRQFIYSLDLAKIIFIMLEKGIVHQNIILSPTNEYTIKDVAEMINSHYNNEIVFNEKYSDGQYKKTADNSKLNTLLNKVGFEFTSLNDGLSQTIQWFNKNYNTLRK